MEPELRRLVDEERKRLVERRQLGRDLAQLGERALAHRAGRGAVAHLVEPVGVGEHERPARKVEDVELDQVDALRDRRPERAQGVLRRERGGAAVGDAQHRAVAALEVDHPSPRRAARCHHQASGTSTSACATAIPAASRETSCQNCSG